MPVAQAEREAIRWGALLLLLFAEIVLFIALPSTRLISVLEVALAATTLLVTLSACEVRRHTIRLGYLAGAVAMLLTTAAVFASGATPAFNGVGVVYTLMALLFLVTPPAIVRTVMRSSRVTGQTLAGALSAYLVIGLFFAFTYPAVNAWSSAPFLAQTASANTADYVYLSFVTLTTVGFGDLTAGTDLGRALVVVEALIGQIYMVTAVARLVSLYPGRATDAQQDPAENGPAAASATTDGAEA